MEKQENRIWWKDGVIYHIYVRSFADSNNDGIGDIPGIIDKLTYLNDLGVEAVWLSPVFSSPNIDFGYDVSDFYSIHPEYGTLDDFKLLIHKANDLGIRIILDIVMNHTSNQHPWFTESAASRLNPKRDWYIWKDGRGARPPTNWKASTGGSAWTHDLTTGQYYLHSFFAEQPDLNWRNPQLNDAFFEIFQFWLDLGVDGFRLDVINLIIKDRKYRNNPHFPFFPALQQHLYTRNRSRSYKVVKKLRQFIDRYEERMIVGEIYVMPPGNSVMAASYLGKGDNSLNLAFDFSLIFRSWNANRYFRSIKEWQEEIPTLGWPCHVLSNHDLFRSIDRVPWRTNKTAKAKVAAVLLLTLRGTPFIYYGEEIGMHNSRIPRDEIKDAFGEKFWPLFSGRDRARTPMQWNDEINAGFSMTKPWLPVDKRFRLINVRNERDIPGSLFNVYRSMIHLRRSSLILQRGRWVPVLDGKNGVLAYFRIHEDDRILVLLNFTGRKVRIALPEHLLGKVLFSTHRNNGETFDLSYFRMLPFEATILTDPVT